MNIFILDNDIKKSAEYHCDKHVVKMIVEYCQLLSTAHYILDGEQYFDSKNRKKWSHPNEKLYKPTHINHPCAVWVRESKDNYEWLVQLTRFLLNEYTLRYNKNHKSEIVLAELKHCPRNIPAAGMTKFVLAMPVQYKTEDAVTSYRQYYLGDKKRFATWKTGQIPAWFKE